MSEINKRLNELAQHKATATHAKEPLVAAKINPVPKTTWPLWALAGLCVTALAGGIGWWLGQQNHSEPMPDVQATKSAVMPVVKADIVKADSPTDRIPEQSAATSFVSAEQEAVALDVKPLSVVKTEAKDMVKPVSAPVIVDMKPETKPKSEPRKEIKPQASQPQETTSVEPRPKRVKVASTSQADVVAPVQTQTQPEAEPELQKVNDGLSIETVELNGKQLADIEYRKAMKVFREGDSKKAINYLESALKYQPDWITVRQKLSALYYGRGDTREAIAVLQQGLSREGDQPDLRLTLAKLLVNESQQQAALNVLTREPEQDHKGYLAIRGALAQQLNNHALALDSYQKLVKTEPYDGRWWMGLGIALERSSRPDKAKNAYQQALLMGRVSQQSQQFIQQRLSVLAAQGG
ncbi:tetratricopeptide repeat protein [Photobacterium sp.]|uniref:tetratricopeptide repeat protein n=1 Tax=Photobacterium sp. TaxID=660 RepID=UPI00299E6801|nr:tetratricopeptide repeat protein [Photobacterium sp.]MDX1303790.1 tetratricopeptide repeat protein [Photobacterium sp.]